MSGLEDRPAWFDAFRDNFIHNRPRHLREANGEEEEQQQHQQQDDDEEDLFGDEEEEEAAGEERNEHERRPDAAEQLFARDRRAIERLWQNDHRRAGLFMGDEAEEDRLLPIDNGDGAAEAGGAAAAGRNAGPRAPTMAQVAAEEARQTIGFLPSTIKAAWKSASLFQSEDPAAAATDEQQRLKSDYGASGEDEALTILGKRSRDEMQRVYDTGDYCFMCWWGDNGEDAVRVDVWNEMVAIWMENIHWMGAEEAAVAVSDFQREKIAEVMRADGKLIGDFPPRMVLEHFTLHVLDPRLEAASALRDLKLLRREILNSIRKTNSATGDTCIDKDQVSNLKSTMQMMRDVYSWNVGKMNFYVPQWRIDTKETKNLFSLHRNFEYAEEESSRTKRKRAARPPR